MSWILTLKGEVDETRWQMGTFPKTLSGPTNGGDETRRTVCSAKAQPCSLKIKDLTDTHIFKIDVRVLGVVWMCVPWPVVWLDAPAVPVLMLATVCYDTRLQRNMFAQSLDRKKNTGSSDTSTEFTFTGVSSFVSMDSSIFTTPIPFNTCPKTTCLPSKWGVGTVVIKNWEPLVFGPAFAMLSRPTLSCYEGNKSLD